MDKVDVSLKKLWNDVLKKEGLGEIGYTNPITGDFVDHSAYSNKIPNYSGEPLGESDTFNLYRLYRIFLNVYNWNKVGPIYKVSEFNPCREHVKWIWELASEGYPTRKIAKMMKEGHGIKTSHFIISNIVKHLVQEMCIDVNERYYLYAEERIEDEEE